MIKSINAAKSARQQAEQQLLRDEMREHHRLRELGVLTEAAILQKQGANPRGALSRPCAGGQLANWPLARLAERWFQSRPLVWPVSQLAGRPVGPGQ